MGRVVGNIGVKNNSSRLKKELKALVNSQSDLWKVLDYMADELPKKFSFMEKYRKQKKPTILLTMIGRGYDPDGIGSHSIDEVISTINRDVPSLISSRWGDVASIPPVIRIQMKGLFYGRDRVSENEWIYKEAIVAGDHFGMYSPHFYVPGKNYGRAVDIRVTGMYDANQADQICKAVNAKFGKTVYGLQCINHAITGGAPHIHLGVGATEQLKFDIEQKVNELCGYENVRQALNKKVGEYKLNPLAISDKDALDNPIHNRQLRETDDVESSSAEPAKNPHNIDIEKDKRSLMPSEIQDNGLQEVLRIGDLSFMVCPVSQISFSQTSQFMRFSALRTKGDPKIATTTAPSNVTVNLIFPNIEAINNEMRSLIAQLIMTPITTVQNRFIARTMKSHYVDHKDESVENKFRTAEDESMWMVLTDINLHSIPGFPDSYEASLTMEFFEDRVFGDKMRFLKGADDMTNKYHRKMSINGTNMVLPSTRSMVDRAHSYTQSGKISVTSDPSESNLYTSYYKSLIGDHESGIKTYYSQTDQEMVLEYNNADLSRDKMKRLQRVLDKQFDESLQATWQFIDAGGPQLRAFINGEFNTAIITKQDLMRFSNGTLMTGTLHMLQRAFQETGIYRRFERFRQLDAGFVQRLSRTIKDYRSTVNTTLKDMGLGAEGERAVIESFDFLAKLAARAKLVDSLPSAGTGLLTRQADIVNSADLVSGDEVIGKYELLIGASIVGQDPDKLTDTVTLTQPEDPSKTGDRNKFENIARAFNELTKAYLHELNDKLSEEEAKDGHILVNGKLPKESDTFYLSDGESSIITGVSFTMANKVAPMGVIGWYKPSFQHLGRSDWGINMSLRIKGDEKIRELMYVMNKTAHLSKQVQIATPMKFIDLDTTMKILNPRGIFKTLGISKMLLSTAQISTVPSNPNVYDINLGFEQADLKIKEDLEKLSEAPFKGVSKLTKDVAISKMTPILKSIIIRDDHPDSGRLLDFEEIRRVIDDPDLKVLWEFLGIQRLHYMDKYNIIKTTSFFGTVQEVINLEEYKKRMFPTEAERSSRMNFYRLRNDILLLSKDIGRSLDNLTGELVEPKLVTATKAVDKVFDLIDREIDGKLFNKNTSHIEHPGLKNALDEYYSNLLSLVNGFSTLSKEAVEDEAGAFSQLRTAVNTGAIGTAAIVALAATPPVLVTILIASVLSAVVIGVSATTNAITFSKKKFGEMALKFVGLIISNKINDIAMELIISDNALEAFPSDLEVGVKPLKDGFQGPSNEFETMNELVERVRKEIEVSITGCYKDFDIRAVNVGKSTGVPAHVIDPAFYLHTNDAITTDLIRENMTDASHKLDMLESRSVIMSIQASKLKDELTSSGDDLGELESEGFIDRSDIDWLDKVIDKMKRSHADAVNEPNKENIGKVKDIYGKTLQNQVLFEVASEHAFMRLIMINEALRWHVLQSGMSASLDKISTAYGQLKDTNVFHYKEFMRDWFPKIRAAGGIDTPSENGKSVNHLFKEAKKTNKTMQKYYGGGMSVIVHQADRLAKIYQALKVGSTGHNRALQYAALIGDPRMATKNAEQIRTLADLMWRGMIDDQTSNTARIFPTYKIYFIEEDAPEWGVFHDFYDYSSVQEITVVKDRESASDVCTIKLSNIAGKLTDAFSEHVNVEFGTNNIGLSSMMLKAGTSILVKMGYSNSQVELPVVFYGIIAEVNAGPIVEIVCQGYGAELNEVVATGEGKFHGALGDVKGLGDVATWLLEQAQGLNHFGKAGYLEMGQRDALRQTGSLFSKHKLKSKIASWWSGMPGLYFNDPRDDNVYLPYNTASDDDVLFDFSNPTFDWFIRDKSIWDALEEVTWFNPDTIKTVLPYNDNTFPFVPKIRNTLYVGPRKGYYKYTDFYSLSGRLAEIDVLKNIVAKVKNLIPTLVRKRPSLGWEKFTVGQEIGVEIADGTTFRSRLDQDFLLFYDVMVSNFDMLRVLGFMFGIDVNVITSNRDPQNNEFFAIVGRIADSYIDRYYDDNGIEIRDAEEDIVSRMKGEVGLTSLVFNQTGENHQYRKVQSHHLVTSHTNILHNNVTATATGWANQIRMLTFEDPKEYTNRGEITSSDLDELVETTFNLDDDILDDHLRIKEVFVNNIDPNLWDDAAFAGHALAGGSSWYSMNNQGGSFTKDGKVQFTKNTEALKEIQDNAHKNLWRLLPSRWRVGVSLLAKEARNMYNGEVTIVGNATIKPFDVVHIIDYVNDMQGAVEVGRVIHTLNPSTGFTTRIKPDLIVNQKDKFNEEEIFYAGKMFEQSSIRSVSSIVGRGMLTGIGALGVGLGVQTAAHLLSKTASAALLGTAGLIGGAALVAYHGYQVARYNAERKVAIMGNTIGRDSLDLLPLTYRGLPYMAGVEGYRKDGPMRHMYSKIFNEDTGRVSVIERLGYANSPWEMEFYQNIMGDSSSVAAVKTFFGTSAGVENATGPAEILLGDIPTRASSALTKAAQAGLKQNAAGSAGSLKF